MILTLMHPAFHGRPLPAGSDEIYNASVTNGTFEKREKEREPFLYKMHCGNYLIHSGNAMVQVKSNS